MAKSNEIDMLNGPLAGKLVAFAIPIALASIFQQLLNTADSIFAGRFIDSVALAAIGGMAPVISLFVGLFSGLGIGANVAVAVHIGKGEKDKIRVCIQTTVIVALITSFIIAGAGYSATDFILTSMGVPEDAWELATEYMHIYFIGVLFLIYYNFGSAILRAKGDTRRPLYALAAAAILNIILDYIGVGLLNGGVQEIAWATVISEIAAAGIVIYFLLKEEDTYRLTFDDFKVSAEDVKRILYIGVPSGLQGALFSLSNIVIQSGINSFGSNAIAGTSAAQNFEFYTWFFCNATTQAATTFIGQNYAAKKFDRCKTIIKYCYAGALGITFVLSVGFTLAGESALYLFTTEAGAITFGISRLWHVEIIDWMTCIYEIPAACMRGMGWSLSPTIIIMLGSCVLRIVYVMFIFPNMYSYENLLLIYPVSWVVTSIPMIILFVVACRRCLRARA